MTCLTVSKKSSGLPSINIHSKKKIIASEYKGKLDSQNTIWRLSKTLCVTEHLL